MGSREDATDPVLTASRPSEAASGRIRVLDTLRGAAVVSMVAFHACYDLCYLYAVDIPWFTSGPVQELWRISISWTFIALAGWMTSHSSSYMRRAGIYGSTALLIWVATSIASVDTPISYGIIYCMSVSTLLWGLLERFCGPALDRRPLLTVTFLFVLFLLTYLVPRDRYPIEGFSWLGFPSHGFSSSDYYPPIPYFFLYSASALLSRWRHRKGLEYPRWMFRDYVPVLTWLGARALPVYLAHQIAILLVLRLILG